MRRRDQRVAGSCYLLAPPPRRRQFPEAKNSLLRSLLLNRKTPTCPRVFPGAWNWLVCAHTERTLATASRSERRSSTSGEIGRLSSFATTTGGGGKEGYF